MIRSMAASLVLPTVGSMVSGEESAGGATERVTNGGFADATGWDDPAAAWTISGGTATNVTNGQTLRQTLAVPFVGGESYAASVDLVVNGATARVRLQLYAAGALVQTILSEQPLGTGSLSNSGTIDAAADELRILITTGGTTSAIDNVSLVA